MNFDQILKKIVAYNVACFAHMLKTNIIGPKGEEIKQLAKHGYQNNLYLAKQLENITLLAGDEDTAEFETGMGAVIQPQQELPAVNAKAKALSPEEEKERRDIAYLDKIYSLEYDEKEKVALSATQEKTESAVEKNGIAFPNDWYGNLFGGSRQGKLFEEIGGTSTPDPEGESPQGQ